MNAYYVTAIDRIGWALAAGGAIGAALGGALAWQGGMQAIAVASVVGSAATLLLLVLVAAPVWTWLHHRGQRGPAVAAVLGAAIAGILGGCTGSLPAAGAAALAGAVIGFLMQRIGYRRLF